MMSSKRSSLNPVKIPNNPVLIFCILKILIIVVKLYFGDNLDILREHPPRRTDEMAAATKKHSRRAT